MQTTYTAQAGQSFDAEILRQDLAAALGAAGWHLNTAGNAVTFVQTDPAAAFDPGPVILSHFDNGPARATQAIMASVTTLVQSHLDSQAQAKGYDDIKSAVTYADEPAVPKFQAEGQAFRAWRSRVWAKCYEIRDAVLAGQRPMPSEAEILAELPALVLP